MNLMLSKNNSVFFTRQFEGVIVLCYCSNLLRLHVERYSHMHALTNAR